jgi:hypothetical protein
MLDACPGHLRAWNSARPINCVSSKCIYDAACGTTGKRRFERISWSKGARTLLGRARPMDALAALAAYYRALDGWEIEEEVEEPAGGRRRATCDGTMRATVSPMGAMARRPLPKSEPKKRRARVTWMSGVSSPKLTREKLHKQARSLDTCSTSLAAAAAASAVHPQPTGKRRPFAHRDAAAAQCKVPRVVLKLSRCESGTNTDRLGESGRLLPCPPLDCENAV